MAYYIGETITQGFTTGTAGESFTYNLSRNPSGATFISSSNITDLGGGDYLLSFTATVAGSYYARFTGATSGEEIVGNWDVDTTTATSAVSAATGALTQTYAQLRQRVADKFEDLVQLTATGNGNVGGTSLVDTYHINPGTEHFNGRDLLCTSGTNAGLKRRITATVDTTGTLTLNSALTVATATSDTFDVFNRRGRGFTIDQYNRAINNAITDAFPSSVIEVVSTITGAFDVDTPEITIPAAVTEVISLEAQDSDGDWHIIPKARSRGGEGWWADAGSGQLRLHGRNAWDVDTLSLRVHGYGRQGALSAESDTCVIRPEFIVAHAAYHLALGAVGNEDMAVRVNSLKRELDEQRVAIRRLREPSTAKVRAA